ncbi:TPA: hypothetical protein ACH3X1_000492 [Trebouxia sp. C0004]
MSCLRHASKWSRGNVADDFGVVLDSVQYVPSVSVPLADPFVKVWSVSDFSILHEFQKPVVVVSAGTYELSHSSHREQATPRVVFQNADCQRRFGLPRSHSACYAVVTSMSEDCRRALRDWELQVTRGRKVQQSTIDIYSVLRPLFQGIASDRPECLIRVESKPIRVETAAGQVHTAVMHTVDMDASTEDLRMTAMYLRSPIHTLMFSSTGALLGANFSALDACRLHTPGAAVESVTLKTLFDMGLYPGGELEAQSAYEEALNAVFVMQLTWRHMQPHRSRRDGKTKWSMIEMWPMNDPVTATPAVLVKRYNITQHKELEAQLSLRQGDLQRQKEDLEQASVTLQQEKLRLQQEAEKLAQQLQAVLNNKFVRRNTFDAETPIDKTLGYLETIISGGVPPLQQALELHTLLSQSDTNLRQPVGLEEQLLMGRMGSDVGQSMLQMLQGNPTKPQIHRSTIETDELPAPWSPYAHATAEAAALTAFEVPTFLDSLVPASLIPEVEHLLHTADSSWQFDVFAFAEATPGHTLSVLFFYLVKQSGVLDGLYLDEGKLCIFLQKMDRGYDPSTPYHSSTHVASVVQMTHMLLCHGGIVKSKAMDRPLMWGTYWAALVHDYEHGGLNNDFLIKTAHPLAITYSDHSPLEHHHVAAATRVFLQPECMYITPQSMSPEEVGNARNCAITQVLGTDMKKHFDILSRFQAAFKRPSVHSDLHQTPRQSLDWDRVKPEDKTLVHQMVIKCADIGHLAADHNTHKRWSYKLEEEFFRQGDKERALGLPISPLMDRDQAGGMTRSQMGFFSIVGIPLFQALTDLFKDAQVGHLALLLDSSSAHETCTLRCDTKCSCGLAL